MCECIFWLICIVRSAATLSVSAGGIHYVSEVDSAPGTEKKQADLHISVRGCGGFFFMEAVFRVISPWKLWQYASRSAYNKQLPRARWQLLLPRHCP